MTPEVRQGEIVERLAEWLYDRDGEEWIREDWTAESEEFKDKYRAEARRALGVANVV